MHASHRPATSIGGGRRALAAAALYAATAFALMVPVLTNARITSCPLGGGEPTGENISASDLTDCGLWQTINRAGLVDSAHTSVSQIIGQVIQAALSLIGVVFLILMIYGGIRWMIARGESDEVTKAKDTIKAAITGIIIVALAFAITRFIIDKIGGAAG